MPQEKQAIEKRGTSSVEAYDVYLMARQYWLTTNQGDARGDDAIIRLCGRAVALVGGEGRHARVAEASPEARGAGLAVARRLPRG